MKNHKNKRLKKRILAFVMAITLVVTGVWVNNVMADETKLENSGHSLGDSGQILGKSGNTPDSGPLVLGKSKALFAAGDVTVALSSPTESFDSFTNINTGAVPPQMSLTVRVDVTKAGLTDINVIVNTDIKDGYLGVGNPYFSYSGHSTIDAASMFDSVVDNADGTVTVKVKDGQPMNSGESITLLFTMDSAYDGNVTPESIMAMPQAVAKVGAAIVGTSNQVTIKTSTVWGNRTTSITPFSPQTAAADGKYNIFTGQTVSFRTRTNNYGIFQNFLDVNFTNVHRYYLPVGTEVKSVGASFLNKGPGELGFTLAAGDVPLSRQEHTIFWK